MALAAEAPHMATAPPVSPPKARDSPEKRREDGTARDCDGHKADNETGGEPTSFSDVGEAQAKPEEYDVKVQERASREVEAWFASLILGQEVECHPDEQRKEQDGGAIVIGE